MLTHEITRTYGIFPGNLKNLLFKRRGPAGEPVPQFMLAPE
jgi:hypothetical protein